MNSAYSLLPGAGLLNTALMERLTLLLNHVLASEPVATERLKAHVDRTVRVELRGWPKLLPALPEACFRITPAGLLEWCGPEGGSAAPSLLLVVDAANPALLLAQSIAGDKPRVEVQGDSALAADVSWLLDNLRWDVRDDLARIVGPAMAERLGRLGVVLAGGLRQALRFVSTRADRRAG